MIDFNREDPVEVVQELTGGIGDAPSQSLMWAVQAVAKAGSIGVIGVYPAEMTSFPTGAAMNKNLTVQMGNCNHRKYIPQLLDRIKSGAIDPSSLLTQTEA